MSGFQEMRELWENQAANQSVMAVLSDRGNPIAKEVNIADFDEELVGFFTIKGVIDGGYLIDYEILIKSVGSQEQRQKL